MTVASSETTRSTHFKLGSLSFTICFFTMASKAMSGVKSPVLHHAESETPSGAQGKGEGKEQEEKKKKKNSNKDRKEKNK